MKKTLTKVQRVWLDALRSGQWPQGRGTLCYKDGDDSAKWCCLGVGACAIDHVDGVNRWGGYTETKYRHEGSATRLVYAELARFGLSEDGQVQLMAMNDTKKLTFPEIADRLEAYWLRGEPLTR